MDKVMYALTETMLRDQNFCYNQLESFNNFIKSDSGLKHIILKSFKIQNVVGIEDTPVIKDGHKQIGKAISLNVSFKDVKVRPFNVVVEEIEQLSKQNRDQRKVTVQDTNIPNEARRTGKTIKVDVIADIIVTLKMFDNTAGIGEPIEQRVETLPQQIVSQIPLMIGSKYCALDGKTKQELIRMQEDPSDAGGYFIIKGNEWSVDATESVKFNELSIQHLPKKHLVRAFVMSKPGDAFEISIQTTIYYCEKTGRIYINIEHERFKFLDIPFFFIFKVFGIFDEVEMTKMIVQDDLLSKDSASIQLQRYVLEATNNEYDMFANAKHMKSQEEILTAIVEQLNSDAVKKKTVDLQFNYDNKRVKETLISYLLPHMGTNAQSSHIKMRFFGHLIRKMLIAHKSGTYPDQNAYIDKRIHSTGQNISKAFRKCYNHQVIRPIRSKLIKLIQKQRSVKIDAKHVIETTLTQNYKNKTLQKSIITGTGTEIKKAKGQAIKNRMQSQKMVRKNIVCTASTVRLINNQKQSQDKQSKKILDLRSIQQAYSGYICIVQSTETSEKAGKVKSLGSMAIITTQISSADTIQTICEIIPDEIKSIQTFDSADTYRLNLIKVFVNGFWIGFIEKYNLKQATSKLRNYRREHPEKWGKVTIYENSDNELHIYSDYGRLLAPFIIVHRDQNGNPYFKFTEKAIRKILNRKATIDWLQKEQIIEYISIEEAHNCLVAESLNHFIEKMDRYTKKPLAEMTVIEALQYLSQPNYVRKEQDATLVYDYTHVFIPHSLFGLVGLLSPFSNHTQTQRITMFTNQAKQSCGWGTFNFPHRLDKMLLVQYYTSQPFVRTVMNDFFPSNGQSIIVSYTCYDGSNQEDSVILNRGALDRGLFECSYYTYEEVQIKFNEFIPTTKDHQQAGQYGNYAKLVNGIVSVGVWVHKDDVLVSKREQNRLGDPHNTSLVYKKDEPAFVEEVLDFVDESETRKIVVKLKCIRKLKQGDKMSSREGCKAIVSKVLDAADMPCTEDGIIPDMIFNPHSIPTRMIIGQIYEAASSRLCVEKADSFDGTVFCNFDIDHIYKELEKYGVYDKGYVTMNNGDTGEQMTTKIFMCPTFYQRLQKFAIQGQYIVHEGPKDMTTRQPIDGRQSDGGIRLGEMEKDCLFSQGSLSIFTEKMYDHADGYHLIFCKNCGYKARFNPNQQANIYACSVCDAAVDLVRVPSAWITNIFQHSINAMNIDMKVDFQQPIIEIPLDEQKW